MRHGLFLFILMFAVSLSALAGPKVRVDYKKGEKGEPSEMRSEGVIRGKPEEVWVPIIRLNDWGRYMPQMPVSFYVSGEGVRQILSAPTQNPHRLEKIARPFQVNPPKKSGGKWEGDVFQIVDLPFPVADRWFLLHYMNDETHAREGKFAQCWGMVAANVKSVSGCFRVSPTDDPEETRLDYEETVDLGGHVPEWVVKIGTRRTTPDVFREIEKEAERLKLADRRGE